jgi:hypothetical protein
MKTMKKSILMATALMMFGGCVPQPEAPKVQTQQCMSAAQLNGYSYDYLSRVAKLLREDRKNIDTFEGFINTMKGTVDDYAQMIKSSIYISNVVRFLPIPYAGEVSNSAKLVSKTVLNLGGAASALNRYKKSSESFLVAFDKLDRNKVSAEEISKLAIYADSKVLADANELRISLKDISESTAAMAATTQSIADALESGSGYMNQAKSFMGMGEPKNDDKTTVVQNRNSINSRMIQLNQKITSLEKSGESHRFNIAKARIYSELALEVEKQK